MIPTRRVMAEIVVAIDIPAERSAADSVLDRLVDLAKFRPNSRVDQPQPSDRSDDRSMATVVWRPDEYFDEARFRRPDQFVGM
jgi:hypothetical protein